MREDAPASAALKPSANRSPQAIQRSWLVRYGAGALAVAAALLLRLALTPVVGPTALPFIVLLPAVLFAAWFGGLRVGLFSTALAALAADYRFAEPVGSLAVVSRHDQVELLIFILICIGMALLSHSQRQAVQKAVEAQAAERAQRHRFETTLASIGDAVISTDKAGRINFVNPVARSLLRAPESELIGRRLDDVFRIVNELTRAQVESPVKKVLREGGIVALANHTLLIALDGTETPIDDSAAPIRGHNGSSVEGTVLVFRDVTARRRSEAAMRLLASIVESSDDAIVGKDLNGVVTSWNRGAERIFGYSATEMIGQPVSLLRDPAQPDEMPQILEKVRRGEHVAPYLTVRRTKAGKLIHASVTVSPVYDATGQVMGASKVLRDMTAQVEAQREIAEQRERLRITLQSIGDAVLTTDADGRVSYLNPVAEKLTGWTAAEAYGQPMGNVFRIINEQTRQEVENPAERVLREGEVVGLANHTLLISRHGLERPIDDSAAPIRVDNGPVLGVVLIFRDATLQREADFHAQMVARTEERVRVLLSAKARLESAEAKFRGLLEAFPDAMIVVDHQAAIVLVNSQVEQLFGYTPSELLGRPLVKLLPERFRPALQGNIKGLLLGLEAGPVRAHLERFGLHKDGHEFPVEITRSAVQTDEGVLVINAVRDISQGLRQRRQAAG